MTSFNLEHRTSQSNVRNINVTEDLYKYLMFKIARPISSQNFMETAKTIDLTHLCIEINNTVVFSNHTHTKLPKQKHVISKRKYWQSNTTFRISKFRTTDIYHRTEWLAQRLGIKIVFPNKLTMFTGILLKTFWYLYRLMMKMKTVSKQQ